jgi:hypothetical protein
LQQLAGEVALQAIRDLRMLRKRGMVKGMKIIKDHQGVPLNDALEYKNSFSDAYWTALPLVAGNGGVRMLTDTSATTSQRFYRVRQW